MPPRFKDFRSLILWLAAQYHAGSIYPMGARTTLSPALLDKWAKGNVKNPTTRTIQKLCDAYGLDFYAVMDLASGRPTRRRLGRHTSKIVMSIIGMWLSTSSGLLPMKAQPIDFADDNMRLIGTKRRRFALALAS